jgi:hypothetical protein
MERSLKSTAEKDAEKVFNAYKRQLISRLGHEALYSDTIDRVGRELFGVNWQGVFHQGNFKAAKRPGGSYAVVNTSHSNRSPGFHWLGVYTSPAGVVYIWDSFGRPIQRIASYLGKKIGKGHSIRGSDNDAQQRGASQTCGPQSLAWLMVVSGHGVKVASLV